MKKRKTIRVHMSGASTAASEASPKIIRFAW